VFLCASVVKLLLKTSTTEALRSHKGPQRLITPKQGEAVNHFQGAAERFENNPQSRCRRAVDRSKLIFYRDRLLFG